MVNQTMKTQTLNQMLPAWCLFRNFGFSPFNAGSLRSLRVGSRTNKHRLELNGIGGQLLMVVAMACLVLAFLGAADRSAAQPVNDNFTNAIPLTNYWVTVTGNNAYATRESGDPTAGDKSVWWSWTAPTSGVYTVTAVGLPGYFYPFLGAYVGTALTNLTLVADNS
jgi:hypothetical protein